MKILTLTAFLLLTINLTGQEIIVESTNVDSTHLIIEQGNLEVNGTAYINNGIVLGSDTNIPKPGTIKFIDGEFLGYDGSKWVSLSMSSEKAILGATDLATDGSISVTVQGQQLTGIEAANAICRSEFPDEPTAHFYHIDEIEKAVAQGNLGSLPSTSTEYWTMASVFRVTGSSYYQTNSIPNNCFNFLSNGGSLSEIGTTVQISESTPYSGQLFGYQVNLKIGSSCNQQRRLICGK